MTTSHGHPVDDKLNTMTAGPRGPVLLQDFVYLDEMAHFDRERIPERVVHAKGAGESALLLFCAGHCVETTQWFPNWYAIGVKVSCRSSASVLKGDHEGLIEE